MNWSSAPKSPEKKMWTPATSGPLESPARQHSTPKINTLMLNFHRHKNIIELRKNAIFSSVAIVVILTACSNLVFAAPSSQATQLRHQALEQSFKGMSSDDAGIIVAVIGVAIVLKGLFVIGKYAIPVFNLLGEALILISHSITITIANNKKLSLWMSLLIILILAIAVPHCQAKRRFDAEMKKVEANLE
jgi:hypothetical protein